jgi:hypothetical protein
MLPAPPTNGVAVGSAGGVLDGPAGGVLGGLDGLDGADGDALVGVAAGGTPAEPGGVVAAGPGAASTHP